MNRIRTLTPLVILFLLAVAAVGYAQQRGRGGGGTYSVPEPAVIALLGAGIVSLGLYAKRKKKK